MTPPPVDPSAVERNIADYVSAAADVPEGERYTALTTGESLVTAADAVTADCRALMAENAALRARVAELEAALARLHAAAAHPE